MSDDDTDLAIIKARKMKELREYMSLLEKEKLKRQEAESRSRRTDREVILDYLYDRGDEVLRLAESQFPIQTKAIVHRIVELIKFGELNQSISGGELLALFRSIGLSVRVNNNIKIEDHGKLISFSERLKQQDDDKTVR
ncbi:MAG TPA: DNA-binding protein [Nitrososphaeraceae archaeon]|jgi:DNA-binding TFAR19-related protein (PDSD5 family)